MNAPPLPTESIATLRLRDRHHAILGLGNLSVQARCGAAGIVAHKQEGDHGTPAGLWPLRRVLYRADRTAPPRCAVPREPLAPDDGWCDDPTHADYNHAVRLPHPGRHERLWRADPLYDVIGVLGYNDSPAVAGRGSAIFMHVAPAGDRPTEGCIGLDLRDLLAILAMGMTAVQVLPPH